MNVRSSLILVTATAMGACASEPTETVPAKQGADLLVHDVIAARELKEIKRIRGTDRKRWEKLTPGYIIYKVRRDEFLVEFDRPCYEIWSNTQLSADGTLIPNTIRARYDNIRGCRIERIFELTKEDAVELKLLGGR